MFYKSKFIIIIVILVIIFLAEIVMAENITINYKEVCGKITAVNLSEKSFIINDEKFYLNKNTKIKVNEVKANLAALKAINNKYAQYAEIIVRENNLIEVNSFYKVFEGEIEKINLDKNFILVSNYESPELKAKKRKYYISDLTENNNLKSKLLSYDENNELNFRKIIAAVGENNLLHIFKLN